MTRSDIITLLSIVVAIVIAVATPDVREYFGIENMTSKRLLILLVYIIVCFVGCTLFWTKVISPRLSDEAQTFEVPAREKKDQLIFSNMSVSVSPENIVTIRTVINTFTAGILQPVKSLKPSNFTVHELFDSNKKVVSPITVRPMKSASQITILVDASESMWGEVELTRKGKKLRKIEVVKDSILKFAKKLVKSQSKSASHASKLSFMIFSGNGVYFLPNINGEIWFEAVDENLSAIETAIRDINPVGQTPMFDAIGHAIDVVSSESNSLHKLMVCLTDGIDNSSIIDPQLLQTKIEKAGIPIVTVGYGVDEELDVPTLNAIATLSGAGAPGIGSFTNVKPKQLPEVFDRALSNINNTYEISWKSSFPVSGEHIVAKLQAAYLTALGKKVSPITEITYTVPSLK